MPITPQEPATIVPLQEPAAPESFQEPIAIVPSQKPIRSSSEANEQRGYISEKGYIGRFLNGTDIKKSFEDAITGLVWEHYHELDNPTYAPNAKARFADHIPHVLHSSLSDFDFEIDIENNQYRLIARDEFFCPVRLRFGLGRVMNSGSDGGCTVFNAKKGKETKKGVKQNHEHFRSQPLLLSRDQMYVEDEDKILNLWLIYEFTKGMDQCMASVRH